MFVNKLKNTVGRHVRVTFVQRTHRGEGSIENLEITDYILRTSLDPANRTRIGGRGT